MNSLDLIKALNYIDDDLVFDAANGETSPQTAGQTGRIKQPKPNKPPRGGAKTKTILIGAVAAVLVAAIVCMVLYFTGVFGGKQVPIYTGMEISSTNVSASSDGASVVSRKYSGDYTGRSDNLDKDNPFGGSSSIKQEAQSTLEILSADEDIYYADAGDTIYVTIKFDNPDEYDIVSFVLTDGTTTTRYGGTYGMFESGSNYDQIIIKLNVGTTGGIIEYTISEIKYLDDNSVNSDVIIGGDTVVRCGVRVSGMTTASVTNETVSLTSLSFTVNITDRYSLIAYSGGYIKAILYDGESITKIVDLELGENSVVFDNLTPDTIYQYAIVAYYDDLSGGGAALNYLYTDAVYTPAIVLFDEDYIEIGQESITFAYSWYEGYSGGITSLTLTGGGETKTLDAQTTSITGLLSDNDYTLTATYAGLNGETSTITLEFTTEAKATPSVEITVTEATVSTLTFNVNYTDTDGVGEITAIGLYSGDELVQSETTNLNQVEYTYSGLNSYTDYTLKVTYTYDLNDGNGTHTAEQTLTENTYPSLTVNSVSVDNTSAVTEGGTIYITASVNNPNGVTYNSVVVNGVTYTNISGSGGSTLKVDITNDGQFAGGDMTLTISQINCTIGGKTYSIDISENNEVSVFIYGELTVENFIVARYNSTSGEYEETYYGFPDEQLYYVITLSNATKYNIDSITIGGTKYSSSEITVEDYQTVYIPVATSNVSATISSISYSYGNVNKTKSLTANATYFIQLYSSDIVEITTADQLFDVDDNKYYKLMNDIDLSSYEWVNKGITLRGVFDGNGYKISGMGAKTTYENIDLNISLFSEVDGVVTNLTLVADYRITLNDSTTYRNVNIGGIANGTSSVMIIDNVNVDITAVVITNADISVINAGGLSSECNGYVYTKNVTVKTNISLTTNGDVYQIRLGGLYGYGSCAQLEGADVTFTGEIITAGSNNPFYIGGLYAWLNGSNVDISDVTINSNVTVKGASVEVGIILGGVIGNIMDSASFYNVTSSMTANISSDLISVLSYNKYGSGNGTILYTDDDCNAAITVNTVD